MIQRVHSCDRNSSRHLLTVLDSILHALSQGEDPGEIRAKSQSGTQQDAKRGSAVKECNGEVKVFRQRE